MQGLGGIGNLTPAEYARRLGDERLRHLPDVEAALNVSYDMLSAEQQQWWSALGVFPAGFDEAAAAAVWGVQANQSFFSRLVWRRKSQMASEQVKDALAGLMRWSLVEFDEETVRYRLHDLARLFAAERLRDAGAPERFARHYCAVPDSCKASARG
jgi:hypothetical protein